ncbi:MAG: hypothetical protein QUU85_16515, partial [Candidatus Eisenbacteria bacterium]|nr:hypothetical protein [Candidatus Eisenbacteria bacterium]
IQEAAAPCLPARRRATIRRAAHAVAAGATIPAELPDDVVLACWRSILRGLAHRGIIEVWNQEHPELARQLRALKRILAKGEGVRIRKENARGQLLVSDGSALHRPCIDRDALQRMLHPIPRSVPDLAGLLPSILVPSEIHGGSAFLMDFLIAWEDVLRREVPPDTEESASSRDGVPIERLAGELPPILRRRARDLLRADQRKGTFPGNADDPACRLSNAYVEISVEMVSRDCGVGNPEWSRLSQKKLIERLLPDVATDGVLARHQQKIDYLVLRLRGTIRVQP